MTETHQIAGNQEKVVREIMRLATHVKIVRHVPGKLHLKFSLFGMASANVDFRDLLSRVPGLLNAEIELLTRSIFIDYDPGVIPAELWEDLARVKSRPQLALQVAARLQGVLAAKQTG